jgi:hypothetical protein
VADVARYVYVPEDWSRDERARRNLPAIFVVVCTISLIAIVAAGALAGAIHWSRRRPFSARAFFTVFGIVFVLSAVTVLNNWPALASQASTAQPLELQAGILIAVSLLVGLFNAAGLGLVAGVVAARQNLHARLPLRQSLVIGVSLGLAIAGVGALARTVAPSISPLWGSLGAASAVAPSLAAALGPLSLFFTQTLILFTVLYALDRRPRSAWIWVLVGVALAGSSSVIATIPSWLVIGAVTGAAIMIAYRLVFRHQPGLLLVTTATLVILSAIRDGVQGMFPSALASFVAGAALVAIAAGVWFRGSMENRYTRTTQL